MTLGFSSPERVQKLKDELSNWTLYQIQVDKYHVMFWFENGHCLLNIAYRFEFRSADRTVEYVYDVQAPGNRKSPNVDSILRRSIKVVEALDGHRLALTFDSDDVLIIHDSPQMRSAWFYRYDSNSHDRPALWFVEDVDEDSL
jgi:hypothetical protein